MKILFLLGLCALSVLLPRQGELPPAAQAGEHHAWLQQLVGEWTVQLTVPTGPDSEPLRMEGSERVRGVGELWIHAEGSVDLGGQAFTSMLTLGYSAQRERFVGTWIGSNQDHLWLYEGQLDETGQVLTLETEGPTFEDPTQMANYRDVIEFRGPNERDLTSFVRGTDGQWTQFHRAEYRRKE